VSDATATAYNYDDRSIDYDDWSSYGRSMEPRPASAPPVSPPAGGARVRKARPSDLPRLLAFADRCSDATLYRRFHGAAGPPVRRELGRVAAPTATHRSWVAVDTGGDVHGTATLAWGRSGTVEAAFLVEDGWFRRGIGRALFAALAAEARRAGVATVMATIQADNDRALRFLLAMAPSARRAFVEGEVEVAVPVWARGSNLPRRRPASAGLPHPTRSEEAA
jgi:GNAT superfamily N-acetyltransferase